jgi:hypothetical protein
MPDHTSTTIEGVDRVGRFDISVVRGGATPASEELWRGRANALAHWLVSEWRREREDDERARIEAEVNSERRAGA